MCCIPSQCSGATPSTINSTSVSVAFSSSSSAPDLTTISAALLRLEKNITGLFSTLSAKVDGALTRLASAESAIVEVRQELSTLDEKHKRSVGLLCERVDEVPTHITEYNAPHSDVCLPVDIPTDVVSVVSELMECEERKRNVMVSGLTEKTSAIANDTLVDHLLRIVCPRVSTSQLTANRMGPPAATTGTTDAPSQPWLLKISLPSTDHVRAVFRNNRQLRLHPEFSGVTIPSDPTPVQHAAYQLLRTKLSSRVRASESGLRIVTRNGESRIVVGHHHHRPFALGPLIT